MSDVSGGKLGHHVIANHGGRTLSVEHGIIARQCDSTIASGGGGGGGAAMQHGRGFGFAMADGGWDIVGEPQMPFDMALRTSMAQLNTLNQSLQGLDPKQTDSITKTLSEDIRRKCSSHTWGELASKMALLIWEQSSLSEDEFNKPQWDEIKNRANFLAGKLREMQDAFPSDHKVFRSTFCALLNAYAILHSILWSPACSRCCVAAEWWIWGMVYSQSNKHNLDRILTRLQLHALYLSSEILPDPNRYFKITQPSEGAVDPQNCLLSSVPTTLEAVVGDHRLFLSISAAPVNGTSSLLATTPTTPSPSDAKPTPLPEPPPAPSTVTSTIASVPSTVASRVADVASSVVEGAKADMQHTAEAVQSKVREVQSRVAALPKQMRSTMESAAQEVKALPSKASTMISEALKSSVASAMPKALDGDESVEEPRTKVQQVKASIESRTSELKGKAAAPLKPELQGQVEGLPARLKASVETKTSELKGKAEALPVQLKSSIETTAAQVKGKAGELTSELSSAKPESTVSLLQGKTAQLKSAFESKASEIESKLKSGLEGSGVLAKASRFEAAASSKVEDTVNKVAPAIKSNVQSMVQALEAETKAKSAAVKPKLPPSATDKPAATALPPAPQPPSTSTEPPPAALPVAKVAAAKAALKLPPPSGPITTETTMGGERCFVTLPETPTVPLPKEPSQYSIFTIPAAVPAPPSVRSVASIVDLPAVPLAVFPTAERSHCLAIVPYQDQRHCIALIPAIGGGSSGGDKPFIAIIPNEDLRHCLAVLPGARVLQSQQQRCMAIIPYQDKKDSCLALIPAAQEIASQEQHQLAIIPYEEAKLDCLAVVPTAPGVAMASTSKTAQDLVQCLATLPGPAATPDRRLAMVPFNERMNCLALLRPDAPLDLSRQCMAFIPAVPEAVQSKLEEQQQGNGNACLAIFPAASSAEAGENCLALIPSPRGAGGQEATGFGPCLSIEPTTAEAAMADKRHCIALIPTNLDASIADSGFSIIPTTPEAALRDASRCFAIIPTAPELPIAQQTTVLAVVPAARGQGTSAAAVASSSSSSAGIAGFEDKAVLTVLPSPSSASFPFPEKQKFLLPPEAQAEPPEPVVHLIKVGLAERAQVVHDHLKQHRRQVLAVAIVGESGLGKTAILREVVSELRKTGEHVVACSETTITPTRETLTETISSIVHQLGGDTREVLYSTLEARQALGKQLIQVKAQSPQQRVCLAIDNVWAAAALRELLPRNLGQLLVPGSVLIITSPSDSVAKVLDELCKPQNISSAPPYAFWCYHPDHLSQPEAKEMFMLHASKRGVQLFPEHEELVDELVPLCGGLPLVLQVVGSHFARFTRRRADEWGSVTRKMRLAQEFQVRDDQICSKLKVIYDGLDPVLQDAFLEVAAFFRGSNWKLVERIFGKHHLAALTDQAFVFTKPKEQQHSTWCTHDLPDATSACRQSLRMNTDVIQMHDMVHSLGFQLAKGSYVMSNDAQRLPEALQNKMDLSTVKGLALRRCQESFPVGMIDKMRKLHVLIFEGTNTTGHCHRPPHQLRYLVWHPLDQGKDRSSLPFKLKRLNKLMVAHLHNIRSDFSDVDFPPKLVELELDNCVKLVELPRSVGNLTWLHSLHLHNCHSLRALPEALGGLVMLQELVLSVCTSITELPQSIGSLHDLEYLDLAACFKLMALPKSIGKLRSLRIIDLTGCESLTSLPVEIGELSQLKELVLAGCGSLKELPPEIGSLMQLTTLDVSHCEQLVGLPQQAGNLVALKDLNMMWCEKLAVLPPQIGFLVALTELELSDCRSLPELPVTVGNLTALKRLHLRGCSNLKVLPPEIGGLRNVSSLDFRGCVALKELPSSEIANMKRLSFLGVECAAATQLWPYLQHLPALKRLDIDDKSGSCNIVPAEIWSLSSLEKLALRGFRRTSGFASGKWNLPLLTSLWMEGFSNVTTLPAGLASLTSLTFLVLADFANLTELPVGIGHLGKLERLSLRCRKLKSLAPEVFRGLAKLRCLSLAECVSLTSLSMPRGSLPALEVLDLVGCTSLTDLPVALVGMSSLERLNCRECTALKALPPEVGELSKLQALYLQQCSTLKDLPQQIGRLTLLERLEMKKCVGLTALPSEIGMLSKLKFFQLSGSTSLKQLPSQIGDLKHLLELGLEGCSSLAELPPAIGGLRRLENLGLDGCTSLTTLPVEVGSMGSLKRLSMAGCKALKALPREVGRLPRLKLLRLDECTSLSELPAELAQVHSLINLGLEGCTALGSLPPGIMSLPNLELLDLRRCPVAVEASSQGDVKQRGGCTIVTNDLDWEGFEEVWLYY